MSNEGKVYLALDGDDFDPEDLTKFLDFEPTTFFRKGSKRPNVPRFNSWEVSTAKFTADYIDIIDMSRELIDKVKSKKDLIIRARSYFNVTPRLQVVLWISMDEKYSTPAIGFDSESVKFLGEIGAFIDIDTYRNS